MSDRGRSERFRQRLEAELATGLVPRGRRTAGDADEDLLALALELRHLDIAGESLVREGLLRALKGRQSPRRPWAPGATPRRRGVGRPLPRAVLVAALTIAAAVGVLAVASPRTLAGLADSIGALFGKRVVVHSPGEIGDALNAFRPLYDEGRYWELKTGYGGTGGDVNRGMKPYCRLYAGIRPLARDAKITVLQPGVWPDHLPEALRFQQGWLNPDGSVWLEFCVGQWEFMLSQTPVREEPNSEYTIELAYRDSTEAGRTETITWHQWDGNRVAWHELREDIRKRKFRWATPRVEGGPSYGSLHWEKDGIRYVLDGQNMTLAWAEEIWKSLRPVAR